MIINPGDGCSYWKLFSKIFTDTRKCAMLRKKSEYKEIYAMLLFIKSHIAKWLAGGT